MKPHPEDDGYRVWLSGREVEQLIDKMRERGGTIHAIGGRLGAHSGLRRDEASKARSVDVQESHGEHILRVWEDAAKMDEYRETPLPPDLAYQIQAVTEANGRDPDDPILDVTGKTLNRWVKRAAEELAAETGDEGWLELTFHDLRRTWGTRLLEAGVLPSVVMWHGGWKDWETFRKHYLGEFSPEALSRERKKVAWLNPATPREERPDDTSPVVRTAAPTSSGPRG